MNDTVLALAPCGTDLYAGGWFTSAGGVAANHVAKWDGRTWSTLGSGVDGIVNALTVSGAHLYVGGEFYTAGSNVSPFAAQAKIGAAGGRLGDLSYSPHEGLRVTFNFATIGESYRIQTSPSLDSGDWTDLTNFIYAEPAVVIDPVDDARPVKFYRAVSP